MRLTAALRAAIPAALFSAGLAAIAFSVQAAEIYKWTDEDGRTHFADSVPDRYKSAATRVDPGSSEVPDTQRKEAEARAAKEKSAMNRAREKSGNSGLPAGTKPATGGSATADARRAADCEILFRRYRESQECFAPYRLANGALRVEAYQRCTEVPDPSRRCGPTPNY